MFKFFADCKTIEDVKELYKRLAMQHHPDRGGNEEAMKQVNAEYETAFNHFKNIHRTASGETYTKTETDNTETAADYADIINVIIHFDGVKIELIGCWLWVTGDTYKYKDQLKELGFKWANTKKAWTWHPEGSFKRSHKNFDIETIREMFGTEEIKTQNRKVLA